MEFYVHSPNNPYQGNDTTDMVSIVYQWDKVNTLGKRAKQSIFCEGKNKSE